MNQTKRNHALYIEIPPANHRFCEGCRKWVPKRPKTKASKGWRCTDCLTVKK